MTTLEQAARRASDALEHVLRCVGFGQATIHWNSSTWDQLDNAAKGLVQALSAAPAGWRELAAKVMDALADAQDTTNSQYPEHVRCYPSWERHARWLRWHADMFRSGNPVGNGAGNPDVLAALAASPTPPAEQQAAPKAAPGEPDPADIIAGALQISRGHAIEMMREALEAAPQQEAQEPVAWESTILGYIKYITQAQYEKFRPNVRRWYKPYKCSSCAAPQPAPATPDGDELRKIARAARTSASDDASPTEYVLAGWCAALAAQKGTP